MSKIMSNILLLSEYDVNCVLHFFGGPRSVVAESPFASPHLPSSKIPNPEICNSDFRKLSPAPPSGSLRIYRDDLPATVLDAIQPWGIKHLRRGELPLPEKEN
jgi:hypothetical protein